MKRVYELDVYKLAEELSDMVWQDFDRWIGIGSSLAATPSHTTGHTGPYPAIRLVKAETDK